MVALAEIAQINPRLDVLLGDDDAVSFLGMADVSESGVTSSGADRRYGDVKKGYTPFAVGDLLVAKITPCFENGKIAQASIARVRGFGSTEFHVVRTNTQTADPRYILHALRSPSVRAAGERRMTGSAGQRRVPKDFLESLDIPLPPLPEQRRIAGILDSVANLRSRASEAESERVRLAESVFDSMFDLPTSPSALALLPRLEQHALQITDGEHLTPRRSSTGVKLLSARNVRDGYLDFDDVDYVDSDEFSRISKRCAPERGDVLISCSGSVGRVSVVDTDERLALVRSVAMVRPASTIRPDYLAWFLRSAPIQREIQKSARSSAQANLFQGPIRALPILVPALDQQQAFEVLIDDLFKLGLSQARHLAKLDELFASLQHRAFRGEL